MTGKYDHVAACLLVTAPIMTRAAHSQPHSPANDLPHRRRHARRRKTATASSMSRHTSPQRTPPASSPRGASAREDDRASAIHQNAVLHVEADGLREHAALHVLAEGHHVRRGVSVRNAGNVLLDDRPLVQVSGHIVGGRTDQLHTTLVSLRVGARTLEGRQERVVDVDDTALHGAAETWSERICM